MEAARTSETLATLLSPERCNDPRAASTVNHAESMKSVIIMSFSASSIKFLIFNVDFDTEFLQTLWNSSGNWMSWCIHEHDRTVVRSVYLLPPLNVQKALKSDSLGDP